jgi:GLPGLI family protein
MDIVFKLSRILSVSFVLSCGIFISMDVKAQNQEPVIAKVYYKFKHQYDTTNTNLAKKENYVLFLGKASAVYKSYDRILQDSAMAADFARTGGVVPPSGPRADGEELYYYFIPKKTYLRVRILGNYMVEKTYNNLKWDISNETKTIANLNCQKATTKYMGREYTAWFTTSLPFQAGPWKLNGLPGLIVSAYDKTGKISFEFAGFEKITDGTTTTSWDKKLQVITWEDYVKIAKAAEDDPLGFAEKRFGGTIILNTPMPHKNHLAPSKYVNFPLEVEPKAKSK